MTCFEVLLMQENKKICALRIQGQNFIVHRTLVVELLVGVCEGSFSPILIDFPALTPCGTEIYVSMAKVSRDIINMIERDESSTVLEIGDNLLSPPSLAGLLLSYPIIYYSEDPNARAMDTTLDVYSVCTNISESKVIMQFSGPPHLRDIITSKTDEIVHLWESRIAQPPQLEAWQKFTGAESYTFKVQIETRRAPIITL
jgi:hypothetical protein